MNPVTCYRYAFSFAFLSVFLNRCVWKGKWISTSFFCYISQNHTIIRYNHEQVTNAVSWFSNYLPAARSEKEASTDSSPSVTPTHQNDVKGVLSPQKPVNLLPEVPIQTGRKLSEREQRDCDVIGMHLLSQAYLWNSAVCFLKTKCNQNEVIWGSFNNRTK